MYDGDYWGGMITDIDIELSDFNVNFMHPKINLKNPKVKYVFPQEKKDECWIICKIDPPKFNRGKKDDIFLFKRGPDRSSQKVEKPFLIYH